MAAAGEQGRVTARHSPSIRGVAGLCAVLFLAAGGALPLDLHDCPHHDLAGGPGHGTHAAAVPGAHDAGAHDAGAPALAGHGGGSHDSDGPYTCVGDCHASADTPVPPSSDREVTTTAFGQASPGTLRGEGSLLGPRHTLFALHLPNAPPASL